MNFLNCGRGLHLQYDRYLVKVGLDSSLSNQIPEEFTISYLERTLLGAKHHIELSEESECFPQVLHVVGAIETLHEHIINVYLHRIPD